MNVDQAQVFWTAVGAIGTVAAFLGAFGFWLYAEYIKPRLESPKLLLEFGNAPPFFESPVQLPASAPVGHWLAGYDTIHLRLRNLKRNKMAKTARNVQVRAIGLYDEHRLPIPGFSPTTLVWSESKTPGYLPLLNPSDYEYLDLFRFDWQTPAKLRIVNNPEIELEEGRYYITLVACGENTETLTQTLEITLAESSVDVDSAEAHAIYPNPQDIARGTGKIQIFHCAIKPAQQISNPDA